jgi:hypothetical protein
MDTIKLNFRLSCKEKKCVNSAKMSEPSSFFVTLTWQSATFLLYLFFRRCRVIHLDFLFSDQQKSKQDAMGPKPYLKLHLGRITSFEWNSHHFSLKLWCFYWKVNALRVREKKTQTMTPCSNLNFWQSQPKFVIHY